MFHEKWMVVSGRELPFQNEEAFLVGGENELALKDE